MLTPVPLPPSEDFDLTDMANLRGRDITISYLVSRSDPDAFRQRDHIELKDATIKGVGLLDDKKVLMIKFKSPRLEDELSPGGLAQLIGYHEKAMALVTRQPIGHGGYVDSYTPIEKISFR